MIITLISWLYYFCVSLVMGMAVHRILSKVIPVPSEEKMGITGYVVAGLCALTVYAEFFSIFYKVGAVCHGIVVISFALYAFKNRKEILYFLKCNLKGYTLLQLFAFACICVIASFYTSRGEFHTDTGIYHAQAIRLLEEYGCIKGLGNFQLHFAYNSSYLVLCALFSMSFILPTALHTMSGFFMVVFSCYALAGLLKKRVPGWRGVDMARIAMLFYSLTVLSGLQSPATDYGTMYMVLYVLTAWIIHCEEKKDKSENLAVYGFLSVIAIFTVSMKLSAAFIVLLSVVPLGLLFRQKKYKLILNYTIVGFLSVLPFLIRNVMISGYLLYPFVGIDIFDVIWKVPSEYVKKDSAQIIVWGRELFDVDKLDLPLSKWLPIWWGNQQIYGKMLIGAQFVGLVLVTFIFLRRVDRHNRIRNDLMVFYGTVLANIAMWFLNAPFIRYGLAFLLILPLCAMGDFFGEMFHRWQIRFITIALGVAFLFGPWIVKYVGDDIEFIQNYAKDGYVLWPIPFEDAETDEYDMNGITVYNSRSEEVNSYYYCPNSCYNDMINRTELIGNTIKDGFKPKNR